MHLADVRDVVERIESGDFHARVRLFRSFTSCGLSRGFIVFHEPRRQGPEPMARFDGTTAQQNLVLPFGYRAYDHFRIFVMDGAADTAHVAWQVVSWRDFQRYFGAAMAAIIHCFKLPKKATK